MRRPSYALPRTSSSWNSAAGMHPDAIAPLPAGQREGATWYAGCVPPGEDDASAVAYTQAWLELH
jgi:hypothetical protein